RLATDEHSNAEFEREQSAGVIDQALTFEDVDDPLWQSDASGDRGGGDGVGGRDYCAEGKSHAPVKAWEEPLRRFGHAEYGEGDQTERQRKDADQVVGELTPGNLPRGGIKKWRQNHEKNDVRVQCDPRNPGDEAEQ